MAGADRMTTEEVVGKLLLDKHADVIREAVKAVAAETMELEVSELIGAQRAGPGRRPASEQAERWLHEVKAASASVPRSRTPSKSTRPPRRGGHLSPTPSRRSCAHGGRSARSGRAWPVRPSR